MTNKLFLLFCTSVLVGAFISFTSSLGVNIQYTNSTLIQNITVNESNNSQHLQGLTPQQVANLFNELDPNYFSNPSSYYNSTTLPSQDLSAYWLSNGSSTATGNWNLSNYNLVTTGTDTASGYLIGGATHTAGKFLRADGANFKASTLILPNAATSGQVIYSTSTNNWGGTTGLTYSSGKLNVNVGGTTATGGLAVTGGITISSICGAGSTGSLVTLRTGAGSAKNGVGYNAGHFTLAGSVGGNGLLSGGIATGGTGSNFGLTLTRGGNVASGSSGTLTGGGGGYISGVAGNGGAVTGTGTSAAVGGNAGVISLIGGTGGAATGGTSGTGGAGSTITLQAGIGGTGSTANGVNGNIIFNSGSTLLGSISGTTYNFDWVGMGNFGNLTSNGGVGITQGLTIMKTAITTCDLNFTGGLLTATTC